MAQLRNAPKMTRGAEQQGRGEREELEEDSIVHMNYSVVGRVKGFGSYPNNYGNL